MTRAAFQIAVAVALLAGCAEPASEDGPGSAARATPEAVTPRASPPAPSPTPVDPRLSLQEAWSEFAEPVLATHAGDDSGRVFVVEQAGRVRVVRDGRVLDAPFLDVSPLVACCGEQGLLGLAFDPGFGVNGRVFLSYTDLNGDSVLARVGMDDPSSDYADATAGVVLLRVEQPYANHNGGHVAFGPDGYLYWSLGDGGSAGDPHGNGQDRSSLLGKILRLDVSGERGAPAPGNPFIDGGGRPEVWDFGLRNPWRFSFDRTTGDLWIGDVGQNAWEEIDFHPAGEPGGINWGWNAFEGAHSFKAGVDAPGARSPVAEYANDGDHCAVTGGVVHRGPSAGSLLGVYLYADYCSGVIRGLWRDGTGEWVDRELADSPLRVSSFGEDEAGDVLVVDHGGRVFRAVGD